MGDAEVARGVFGGDTLVVCGGLVKVEAGTSITG